jgi:hypothetical protein
MGKYLVLKDPWLCDKPIWTITPVMFDFRDEKDVNSISIPSVWRTIKIHKVVTPCPV